MIMRTGQSSHRSCNIGPKWPARYFGFATMRPDSQVSRSKRMRPKAESPEGGTGFSHLKTGCHLIGVYRISLAGLEARLGVHVTVVSGPFSEPPPEGGT